MSDTPCRYVRGFRGERVVVPGCWSTALGGPCQCERPRRIFEAQLELEDRVAELERLVAMLTGGLA